MRSSKSKAYIVHLSSHDSTLTDDPRSMSELLLNQYNSVISVTLDGHIVYINYIPFNNVQIKPQN